MFNSDLSAWDVSVVTDMRYMFFEADSFNGTLSAWDVSSVTDMSYMFFEVDRFDDDISKWDIASVKNMSFMFYYAEVFNVNLCSWKSKFKGTARSDMFVGTACPTTSSEERCHFCNSSKFQV